MSTTTMITTTMIGNKIAEARKKINLSQAQLAERLFVSPQAVGKWERGESMPDIITFNRLAETLKVDLNYFSERFPSVIAGPDSHPTPAVEPPAGPDERSLPPGKPEKGLRWDMSCGNWVDADFSGLKDLHEKFSSSNMQRCLFIGSELVGLLLKNNNVDRCDFLGSDLSRSRIRHSNLAGNLFKDCSLRETEFTGAYIHRCDFTGADFTGVVIRSGGCEKNTLADAIWKRSSFINTNLIDLVFEGAVEDCSFENCSFRRVTFQNATLINTFFKNSNLKRIRFIDCKADKLTYAFLKNGKAALDGVTLLDA